MGGPAGLPGPLCRAKCFACIKRASAPLQGPYLDLNLASLHTCAVVPMRAAPFGTILATRGKSHANTLLARFLLTRTCEQALCRHASCNTPAPEARAWLHLCARARFHMAPLTRVARSMPTPYCTNVHKRLRNALARFLPHARPIPYSEPQVVAPQGPV